jgi:hypothetical protein
MHFADRGARLRRHLSIANVLAASALFIALGGTSVAADATSAAKRLITGKQIRSDAITGRHVKNGSLRLGDFRIADRARLKGEAGPAGLPGAPGPAGAPGRDATPIAYGKVLADGSLSPGAVGVVSVEADRADPGHYCVDLEDRLVARSVTATSNDSSVRIVSAAAGSLDGKQCDGVNDDIVVRVGDPGDGDDPGDFSFIAAVEQAAD